MTVNLDRTAPCPNCGADVTFPFGGARAVVCDHCRYVVARTDRGLEATGRMADLLELPTPFQMGRTGHWNGEPFEVEGRLQMDRTDGPSAPWEEVLLGFPLNDRHTWVAHAQGRWYATNEVPLDGLQLPPFQQLRPGASVNLGQHGAWVVQEIGQRRLISGEGAMTHLPSPAATVGYADISAPDGRFGSIDFGDTPATAQQPAMLFLGRQFVPSEVRFDDGMPLDGPSAKTTAVECPNCGGNLPLLSETAERIVCPFCRTASDIHQGSLRALGPTPPPPINPAIAVGSRGQLRGHEYVVTGFMVRSCVVEGIRYPWTEYLLYGGKELGYRWVMQDEGSWSFVEPFDAGEVTIPGPGDSMVVWQNQRFLLAQTVLATTECVIGEFYWKVEIGEQAQATEWKTADGARKVSRERTSKEVNFTFISPMNPSELAPFGLTTASHASGSKSSSGGALKLFGVLAAAFVLMFGGICFLIARSGPDHLDDVIDGDVKLDATEVAALKAIYEAAKIQADRVQVQTSCRTCEGLFIKNGHVTGLTVTQRNKATSIDVSAFSELQTLRWPNGALTTIVGLGALTKLQTLKLDHNQLTDVGDLSNSKGLSKVELQNNQLASISGLHDLPRLSMLDLRQNPLATLNGIGNLPRVAILNFDKTKLTSFEGVGPLAVKTLSVQGAKLTSLKGLEQFSELTELHVERNQLTSLDGLKAGAKLKQLYVAKNQITAVGDLSGAPGLRALNIDFNKLTTLEGIASPTLETLNASDNFVTSLTGLDGLPKLKNLYLRRSKLQSLAKLGDSSVERLYVQLNPLKSIQDPKGSTKLKHLELVSCNLGDIDTIGPYPALERIDLSKNNLTKLGAVASLTTLTTLAIGYNRITSLAGVEKIPKLQRLHAANNKLTSLTPIGKLPYLIDLNARNNQLTKEGMVEFTAKPPANYDLSGNIGLTALIIGLKRGSYKPPPPRPVYAGSPGSRYRSGGGPGFGK